MRLDLIVRTGMAKSWRWTTLMAMKKYALKVAPWSNFCHTETALVASAHCWTEYGHFWLQLFQNNVASSVSICSTIARYCTYPNVAPAGKIQLVVKILLKSTAKKFWYCIWIKYCTIARKRFTGGQNQLIWRRGCLCWCRSALTPSNWLSFLISHNTSSLLHYRCNLPKLFLA